MNRSTTHEYPITSEPALKNNGTIRCAIYTRKSTEEGLEQEFNSLDAQRESAEAYIISQRHEGWICLPDRYDDGGFSGGNMERPALQHLFSDIEAGGIDCVVVYKVERMSRALLDFSRIIDLFDKHRVSFVSFTVQIRGVTTGLPNEVVLAEKVVSSDEVNLGSKPRSPLMIISMRRRTPVTRWCCSPTASIIGFASPRWAR
jgi:site-specific DNA recombinase